jgi:hypothetical protein
MNRETAPVRELPPPPQLQKRHPQPVCTQSPLDWSIPTQSVQSADVVHGVFGSEYALAFAVDPEMNNGGESVVK